MDKPIAGNGRPGRPSLSADELEYLRGLFSGAEGSGTQLVDIGLHASTENELLLGLLREMDSLRLSADYGDYRFVFPLDLMQEESGFNLQIRNPRIYDTRGQARSWRAAAQSGDIDVIDCSGRLRQLRVVDISISGISILADAEAPADLLQQPQLTLLIKIPDLPQAVEVSGSVVRHSVSGDRQLLAVKFSRANPDLEEAICAYLLRAHRAQSESGDATLAGMP